MATCRAAGRLMVAINSSSCTSIDNAGCIASFPCCAWLRPSNVCAPQENLPFLAQSVASNISACELRDQRWLIAPMTALAILLPCVAAIVALPLLYCGFNQLATYRRMMRRHSKEVIGLGLSSTASHLERATTGLQDVFLAMVGQDTDDAGMDASETVRQISARREATTPARRVKLAAGEPKQRGSMMSLSDMKSAVVERPRRVGQGLLGVTVSKLADELAAGVDHILQPHERRLCDDRRVEGVPLDLVGIGEDDDSL